MPDCSLSGIKAAIAEAMRQTSMAEDIDRLGAAVDGGKMLRGRLVTAIGATTGMTRNRLCRLGAAVELLHGASLLHDDIVDGGTERRHTEALWVSEGTKAAVLVGDLMLSVAMTLIQAEQPARLPTLIRTLKEMCEAEAEQEFCSDTHLDSWEDCLRIARHKTGSLFGLAAACAAGADDTLADALERAGRDIGTAYQLADDMLDVHADPAPTGKSLGTDAATGKVTAATASALEGIDPVTVIADLLDSAEGALADWPEVQQGWRSYVDRAIQPLIEHFTSAAA
jgi:geranylgeranyl diphosphate synthase type I